MYASVYSLRKEKPQSRALFCNHSIYKCGHLVPASQLWRQHVPGMVFSALHARRWETQVVNLVVRKNTKFSLTHRLTSKLIISECHPTKQSATAMPGDSLLHGHHVVIPHISASFCLLPPAPWLRDFLVGGVFLNLSLLNTHGRHQAIPSYSMKSNPRNDFQRIIKAHRRIYIILQ